ncbi:tRNA-binding protein [Natronohydrobacter thiooxidans]|jgi:tRNA-binding protein|uniref:tRNA-binding protein n=1 Tax=Natronohydrobacter thiooxidans TaxID=87172 RepID=UPI0008FF1CC3|nr:tRNA-binding protein [Natronohydrobacter thiooxidans]
MSQEQIIYDEFAKVDMRIGQVISVAPFARARVPSYKVEVDLGDLGTRWSSAQITSYPAASLIGQQVVCVVNLAPRNIAGFQSEVLILGANNDEGNVMILTPAGEAVVGSRIF